MRGTITNIQALRALAAILVVVYHIRSIFVGRFGVTIFFVISGFIVCYISQKRVDNFFAHRLIRIVPLYWVATLGIFFISLIAPSLLNTGDTSVLHLAKSLSFIPYLRPNGKVEPLLFLGWTLNYEMFFYVVFAGCLAIFKARAPIASAMVLILIVAVTYGIQPGLPWSFWGDWRLLGFVCGIGAFFVWRDHIALLNKAPKSCLYLLSILSLVSMAYVTRFEIGPKELLVCLPASTIAFLCAIGLEGRMCVPDFVLAIGNASYSLYLLHPYVIRGIEKAYYPATDFSSKGIVSVALIVIMSVALSLLCFRYFEAPTIKYFRRKLDARQLRFSDPDKKLNA